MQAREYAFMHVKNIHAGYFCIQNINFDRLTYSESNPIAICPDCHLSDLPGTCHRPGTCHSPKVVVVVVIVVLVVVVNASVLFCNEAVSTQKKLV